MTRPSLEQGHCSDLRPEVFDKYFLAPISETFRRKTAKVICEKCVVVGECRLEALRTVNNREDEGIVAGLPVRQYEVARAWERYEIGDRDTAPRDARPEWLPRSDAAEAMEQARTELELGIES